MRSTVITFCVLLLGLAATSSPARDFVARASGHNVSSIRIKDAHRAKACKTLCAEVSRDCDCGPVEVEFAAQSDCDEIKSVARKHGFTKVKLSSGRQVELRKSSSGKITVDYDD